MPVYVYRNLRTGERFEVEQRITEPALTEHPQSGDPVKRLVQPVGIAFKGSGFYVTDSRSNGQGKASTSDKQEAKKETGDQAKSESKSESKSETTSSKSSTPEKKSGSSKTSE